MNDELLNLGDIASLYRCSRRHARDVITKLVGFPELAPGTSTHKPRWIKAEVRAFLHSLPKISAEERDFISIEQTRFANNFAEFSEAIRGAKRRATRKGRDCDLTQDDAKFLWDRCNGSCEVTGIQFDFTRIKGQKSRPFSPSIDRLDNSKGYTRDNVRVVCTSVNVAMNQWGEHVLHTIAEGLIRKGKK